MSRKKGSESTRTREVYSHPTLPSHKSHEIILTNFSSILAGQSCHAGSSSLLDGRHKRSPADLGLGDAPSSSVRGLVVVMLSRHFAHRILTVLTRYPCRSRCAFFSTSVLSSK